MRSLGGIEREGLEVEDANRGWNRLGRQLREEMERRLREECRTEELRGEVGRAEETNTKDQPRA